MKQEKAVRDERLEPLVSVIIVNHNRAELLSDCINSILDQSYPNLEVLVVDNGSSDHSEEVVNTLRDSRLSWIPLYENLGFAGGCNRGLERASGEFVALLNNDATVENSWVDRLIRPMSNDPQIGMCASKILFHGTNVIDKVGHLMYLDGQNRGRGTGEEDEGQYDCEDETLFPDGCAALYRGEAVSQISGFDEDFFAYGDDADLGIRLRLLGWSCRYVPEARVYHHHSSTLGSYSPDKVYWVERNRFWLAMKCFPMPLLLLNPLLTANRWAWNTAAFLARKGPSGNFRDDYSFWRLGSAILRAYFAGIAGAPQAFRKRRAIRAQRRLSDWEFLKLLWRFRISAREVAFRDR
jgi:GT2 family glycosyltransferase